MSNLQAQNIVLKWDDALYDKCLMTDAEVYFNGDIYHGKIEFIREIVSAWDRALRVKLTAVVRVHSVPFSNDIVDDRDFLLTKCHQPLSIKDAEYDCLHISCEEGRLAVYFKRPTKK